MFERTPERLYQLEQKFEGLQAEMSALKAFSGGGMAARQTRLAEVTSTPIGSTDNTFQIVFLDGRFTETAGVQSPQWRSRQQAARAVAYNLAEEVIPVGTRLPVYQWSDRWWCYWTAGSGTPPPLTQVFNVFWDETYWHFGGPYDGTEETGANPEDESGPGTLLTPNHEAFLLKFAEQAGPNMGIVLQSDPEQHVRMNTPGTYVFHFRCQVRPWRFYSVSNPTDKSFMFQVQTLDIGGSGLPEYTLETVWAPSDFGPDTNQVSGQLEYGPNLVYMVNGWKKVEVSTFVEFALEVIFWTEYSPTYSDVSDYGWRMQNAEFMITRVE